MCTAATYKTKCFYFGRNLDYERGFGEQVVITPRLFPLPMRHLPDLTRHYAMIGMASVQDGYPLYYDAVNEKGLCMAGLNFVRSAVYGPCAAGKANVAQFELIPWLLGRCATAAEARDLLVESRITDDALRHSSQGSPDPRRSPAAPLHLRAVSGQALKLHRGQQNSGFTRYLRLQSVPDRISRGILRIRRT